ncbi:MAG: DUF190 domain-containing protein [Pseudomonadota bacterium]
MLAKGAAKKVTIYLNEDTRHRLGPLYEAILTFLLHKGVAGATASRALSGFGGHQVLHTPKIEALAEHLPVRVEFIESAEKVDELLPALYEMVTDGLIEVQETMVVKAARKEKPEAHGPIRKKHAAAKLLRIFLGEADQWNGEPLHEAIVQRLRMLEVAGATVYRGIAGYGAKGHAHNESFLHLSRDLPVLISVADTPEKIEEVAAAVAGMLGDGLIVVSDVEMTRLVRGAPAEGPDAAR